MKQKVHEEWAELQNAKNSIFNSLKPDAFMKYEENLRQAAGWLFPRCLQLTHF